MRHLSDIYVQNSEEEEEEYEGLRFTIKEIESMTDEYFPIRKNGKPTYRENQRETIIKIATAFFIDGKKYVAVDGPVGCGKSAINYTVSMMSGDAVYLTPLKMLQDQIAAEGWPGVKMLKGASSYACNFCGYDTTKYRANYSGEDFDTCQNSKEINNFNSKTLEIVGNQIEKVHESLKDNKFELTLRSSFSSPEEFRDSYYPIRDFLMDNRKNMARAKGNDDSSVKYKYDVEKALVCSMDPVHECPHKSSKILAKMSPIKVLNPDIFFALNKSGGSRYYGYNGLMVYDECQQIEGVINRIFKAKIPLQTLKEFFGIDMDEIYEKEEIGELLSSTLEFINGEIGPLTAASKTIYRLGEILSVRNYPTLKRIRSNNSFVKALKDCAEKHLLNKWVNQGDWEFSMLEVVNAAFKTEEEVPSNMKPFLPFILEVGEYFIKCCEKYMCNKSIDIFKDLLPSVKKLYTREHIERLKKDKTSKLRSREDFSDKEIVISDDRIYAEHISLLRSIMDPFITSFESLNSVSNDDKPAFTISKSSEYSGIACSGTLLHKEIRMAGKSNRIEKCLEIVPISIDRLMRAFFYKRSEKVLLTSGTWVGAENLFKLYGLDKDDMEFIKIPSTFPKEKRPVFVVDNKSFTDFSEREGGYGGVYKYKTEIGIRKFTLEIASLSKRIRRYIKDNHNENSNIIIHCHTFDIAKKIAEYCPGVDKSYLIHLPDGSFNIRNKMTGHTVVPKDKNELINIMSRNPNKGLTIVSPSISEGVDFKNDIARAQIILKRPIPYLGDVYVRSYYKGNPDVGIDRDPDFLDRVCFTTMIQQYGRVMRSVDDWGYTIVMDQSITKALKEIIRNGNRSRDLNLDYLWDGLQYSISKKGDIAFNWIFG